MTATAEIAKIRWRHLYVRYSYCFASVVKQVVAAGLRAQILFWSFHGRPKMRGRMPRPARIVEYGARESDKIGIASSNDRLSLIITSDETDRDGRQVSLQP